MAEAVLTRRSVVKNEYELLADITVSSATTQVDITGLNIGKGDEVVLVVDIINTSGSVSGYRLYANTNYTDANYWAQVLASSSTTVSGSRYNEASFTYLINNAKAFNSTNIKLTNSGHFVYQSCDMREYGGSGVSMTNLYTSSTFTLTSITALRVKATTTNAIGIGSRFQLYKVAK